MIVMADLDVFVEKAVATGAYVVHHQSVDQALRYIKDNVTGTCLVPQTDLTIKYNIAPGISERKIEVVEDNFREAGHIPAAGVSFVNFALADTGTLVIDSTAEDVRLATSLPTKHFALLDPQKIITDNLAAIGPMEQLHQQDAPCFIAYITGPSRTADIERVLTIGCHGPKELHILLVPGISDSFFEI